MRACVVFFLSSVHGIIATYLVVSNENHSSAGSQWGEDLRGRRDVDGVLKVGLVGETDAEKLALIVAIAVVDPERGCGNRGHGHVNDVGGGCDTEAV